MHGAPSRASIVGDLIVFIACSREHFIRREELLFIALLVGVMYLTALAPSLERRVRLHGQPITTDVRRREFEGSCYVIVPGALQFRWQRKNQVERPIESCAGQCLDGTHR